MEQGEQFGRNGGVFSMRKDREDNAFGLIGGYLRALLNQGQGSVPVGGINGEMEPPGGFSLHAREIG